MSKELKTQFVKVHQPKQNKNRKGCGNSQMATNNFSRRNAAASINSTALSTNSLNLVINHGTPITAEMTNNSIIANKCYNRRMHSQQSWSMSHFKNHCKKNKKNYEFTEQRCNYERLTQQQQLQLQNRQQQRPWSSEQVTRCNISNSSIQTCLFDQNQHDLKNAKFCDAINAEFLALNEFRMQNSKDCFSDRHHRLLQLRAQTSPPHNKAMTSEKYLPTMTESSETQPYAVNWWFNENTNNSKLLKDNENVSTSLLSSFSSLSLASLSPIPYAARQRILREQLAKEFPRRKSLVMSVNKSTALSYQSKY